jgi:hypothetical protein
MCGWCGVVCAQMLCVDMSVHCPDCVLLQTREGVKIVGALALPDAYVRGEVWHDGGDSADFENLPIVQAGVSFAAPFPPSHPLCESSIYEEVRCCRLVRNMRCLGRGA